jgi:hypothetical protein
MKSCIATIAILSCAKAASSAPRRNRNNNAVKQMRSLQGSMSMPEPATNDIILTGEEELVVEDTASMPSSISMANNQGFQDFLGGLNNDDTASSTSDETTEEATPTFGGTDASAYGGTEEDASITPASSAVSVMVSGVVSSVCLFGAAALF